MKNYLWFPGGGEEGTIVLEAPIGLVVMRGLTNKQVQDLCDAHNAAIKNLQYEYTKSMFTYYFGDR